MERDKSLPLHLKYRPKTLDEIVGNESTVEALQTVLARESGEVRTFLFVGPSGSGKTTLARIVASTLGCSENNFYEYNAANTRGIDTVREIANNCRYSPLMGKYKIYLLDEVHKVTSDAQHALLKLLEDTPKHVRFLLCTTDPEKLLKTIKTRCSTFMVSSLRKADMLKLLTNVCSEEGVELSDNLLLKIVEAADGCPRQALVILDQIIDIPDDEKAIEAINKISDISTDTIELCKALLVKTSWDSMAKIIKGLDEEPEKVRYAILTYMTKVLLDKESSRAADIIEFFSQSFIYSGKAGLVQACFLVNRLK